MADIATLTAWLAEAEQAYHNLNMGLQAKVVVDQNGERIEYNASTRGQLFSYIQDLKRQLGVGTAGSPLQVWM
jgi:hypothetical protein